MTQYAFEASTGIVAVIFIIIVIWLTQRVQGIK